MWFPSKLINEISVLIQGVESVEITPKIGSINNELKKYRRDVIIRLNKETDLSRNIRCFAYSLQDNMAQCALEYGDDELLEVINGKDSNGLS